VSLSPWPLAGPATWVGSPRWLAGQRAAAGGWWRPRLGVVPAAAWTGDRL